MSMFAVAGVASSIFVCTLAYLVWKLMSSTKVRGVDPAWHKDFSVEKYRPLERLLSEDDVRFLKEQPGYEPGMEKAFRRERRKVFRSYLKNLGQDFNRLHSALRLMVLYAPETEANLATKLVQQKAVFFAGLAMVHLRLCLHGFGLGQVDVGDLVNTLAGMREALQSMVTSAYAVPAQSVS